MPIYEYECADCGAVEEAFQKFSDEPLTTCAHCSGKLHKLISHSAFHLKGSGWYVTDYAKNKSSSSTAAQPKTEKTPTASSSSSEAKDSKKSTD